MSTEPCAVIGALLYLVPSAVMDLRTGRISLTLTAAAAVPGLVIFVPELAKEGPLRAASLLAGLLLCGFAAVSGGAVGFGDGLALLILGLFLPWDVVLAAACAGFLLLAAASAFLLLARKKKRRDPVPYLPFLLPGLLLVLCLS